MALKKPSDLFGKKETSGVFETPEVSPHITESYNKFVDNFETVNEIAEKTKVFEKVDELSERVELLSKELSEKLTRTDLENAMLSQLMVLDENFKTIQSQVKGLNKEDLKEFKSTVSNLSQVVDNLVETELPKYRNQLAKSKVFVGEQVEELQEIVKENITGIREEVEEKFDNIAEVIDSNLEYFNNQLQETSFQVKKTTDTYNKISKIVENKVAKENERLEEYSQVIEELQETFIDLQKSLNEEISLYQETIQSIVEEKIETVSSDVNSKIDNFIFEAEEKVNKVFEIAEDVKSEISNVKADVVIFEKHNKDTGKTIQEFSEKLSKISKIDDSIHTLEESVEHLQSQYEVVSNATSETKKDLELIETYIQSRRKDIVDLKEEVFSEIEKLPVGNLQENIKRLEKKIDYIKETYSKIEPEVIVKEVIREGLLNEPSDKKNTDPLTPLDQNFVTLDQLQQHYRLFLNRIQQQLSTLGGGGEVRLEFLDDIDRDSAKVNGRYLRYDSASDKWIGATAGGSGSQTLDDTLLLGNTSSLGMSVGVITATSFSGNATSATYATTAGVSTTSGYSTTAGVSTSVIGGIGSITQLRVSGVSTLGVTTFTGNVSFGTSAFFGTDDRLILGDSSNLQLYYNSVNSIVNASAGLIVSGSSITYSSDAHSIQNAATTRTFANFAPSGTTFYYNNNTRLQVTTSGITVTGTTSTDQLSVSGVTTSTGGFVGNLTGNASSATYATTAGISTYATTAGVSTTSGYATIAGIATYATTAGVSTYATTAGVSTSVIGGISSVTQLQVTGVSTFTNGPVLVGSATSTGTASQRLQVTGGGYFSGNVGIGTTISVENGLSVLPKIQILNNSNADGRLILRAKPGNSYRWNLDNDGSTNNLRFFREDDATAANGTVPLSITPTGNATLSGNLNSAGNYYVKVARTSNQTITTLSDTVIAFSSVSDPNSWFNAGNSRITPNVAGNYYVSAMVNWAAGAATNTIQTNIQIRKTGTTIALSQIGIQTHAYTMNVCAIATLNGSTDYIELTAYTGNPTSQVVTGDASGTLTKLELFKLN